MNNKDMQKNDPVKAQKTVSRAEMGSEMSPMDAPDQYEPPAKSAFEMKELNPFFQSLMSDHVELKEKIAQFKEYAEKIGLRKEIPEGMGPEIRGFFEYFEQEFIAHNKKEEKYLFPILKERLLATGEHSPTKIPITGVDVLEDEHVQGIQLSAIAQSMFEMYHYLPEARSKSIVLQKAVKASLDLVELIELHIFREDEIIFGLGQTLLSKEQLESLAKLI